MKCFTKITLLTALHIPLLLSNCVERKNMCEETKHYNYFVKPEDKAVLPYKGFDTLRLKHSSGAEYTFYAGAIDSLFTITAKSTSPDCANNIIQHMETSLLEFNTLPKTTTIEIGLYREEYATRLQITMDKVIYHSRTSDLPLISPRPNFFDYDSLVIQGKEYKNIRKVYQNSNITSSVFILFNRDYGILKIVKANGETFERIP